jgi:hypothetical protein
MLKEKLGVMENTLTLTINMVLHGRESQGGHFDS